MAIEDDIQELKDIIASVRADNAALRTRVTELEDFAQTHVGMDWGTAGLDINSPHPNQSMESGEYGGGVMRFNRFGQQIRMPDNTGVGRASYYFVKEFWNSDDQAGHYRGDPSAEWQAGYSTTNDYGFTTLTEYLNRDAILSGPFSSISLYARGPGNASPGAEVLLLADYDGDGNAAELRIKEDSAGNFTYQIHRGFGVYADIGGGALKTANTGQYLIPASPGTGGAVRSGANAYGAWSGIGKDVITAPASPTQTAVGAASTTHNITMPATVNSGDLLIAIIAFNGNPTLSAVTGWTNIKDLNDGASTGRLAIYYKVADGTEDGATVNFGTTGSVSCVANVYRILAGEYEGAPQVSTGTGASSTNPNPDAVTPLQTGNFLAIAAVANNTAVCTAAPAGYSGLSTQATSGADEALSTAYRLVNSNTEDPGTFTNATNERYAAATIAIQSNASSAEALYITGLDVVPSGSPTYTQIQLATGAIGAESIIGTYSLMNNDPTLEFAAVIPVATSTRISARVASSAAAANFTVKLHVINQDDVI